MQNPHNNSKETHMKNVIADGWKALGTTGKIFLACFAFFLLIKAFKH